MPKTVGAKTFGKGKKSYRDIARKPPKTGATAYFWKSKPGDLPISVLKSQGLMK